MANGTIKKINPFDLFVIRTRSSTVQGDGQHYYVDKTYDISLSGYTPVLVGFVGTDNANIRVSGVSLNNNSTLTVRIVHQNNTIIPTETTVTVTAFILYQK